MLEEIEQLLDTRGNLGSLATCSVGRALQMVETRTLHMSRGSSYLGGLQGGGGVLAPSRDPERTLNNYVSSE